MAITCIAAALLGVLIGVLSGLLGIGGGTVMVPAFRLLFDMGALASTATSLFTIIPTSISGVLAHLRNKTCIPKLGVAMGVGGALTSPLGVWLAQVSPSWAVMLAAAIVIGYSAFTMVKKALALPSGTRTAKAAEASSAADKEAAAPNTSPVAPSPVNASAIDLSGKQLAKGLAIGVVAGIVSGYIGVGGGFLMVPLMISLLGVSMKQAAGTSLVSIMILAIPGVITQGVLGNIDYLVGIATAVGTVPGAYLGGHLVSRVPERALRFLFAAFLGVGAVLLVVKELA